MQSLKDLTLMVSDKKLTFFFLNEELCQLSPLRTHQSCKNHIVHDLLNVCSNYTTFELQCTDKNPKQAICSLHFRYTCDLETVKVIKPRMTM